MCVLPSKSTFTAIQGTKEGENTTSLLVSQVGFPTPKKSQVLAMIDFLLFFVCLRCMQSFFTQKNIYSVIMPYNFIIR